MQGADGSSSLQVPAAGRRLPASPARQARSLPQQSTWTLRACLATRAMPAAFTLALSS
jgi:hypothetical protein